MNRRDSLRLLGIGTLSAGAVLEGCQPKADSANKAGEGAPAIDATGRQEFEIARDKELTGRKFFDAHEMTTITLIAVSEPLRNSGEMRASGGDTSAPGDGQHQRASRSLVMPRLYHVTRLAGKIALRLASERYPALS